MEADARRLGLVKKIRIDRALHVGAQFLPGVRLRENVVRHAFGDEATVCFLSDAEHDFHWKIVPRCRSSDKHAFAPFNRIWSFRFWTLDLSVRDPRAWLVCLR